jgi:hypothetical protein
VVRRCRRLLRSVPLGWVTRRRRITHPTTIRSEMSGFTALLKRSSDVVEEEEEEEEAVVVDIRATTLTMIARRVMIEAVGVDAEVDEEAVVEVVEATRATGRITTRMNTAKGDS